MFSKRYVLECTLFIIAPNWKLPKCPSAVEWITNWSIFTQCNTILHENEQTTTVASNVDESYKHNSEQKKSDTKKNILYISFTQNTKAGKSHLCAGNQDSNYLWLEFYVLESFCFLVWGSGFMGVCENSLTHTFIIDSLFFIYVILW